jgi:hypothetical protein
LPYRLAADLVALLHVTAIVFAIVGALLAWRWHRLVWPHLAVFGAIAAINLTGSDCPLTNLEKHLRVLGGETPYRGGYIAHYLVDPVHPGGITPTVDIIIYMLILLPTVVGYAGLAVRRHGPKPRGPAAPLQI